MASGRTVTHHCVDEEPQEEVKLAKPQLDIGLVTSDSEKARAFYGDILGFSEEEAKPFGSDALQYRFRTGNHLIKLMDYATTPASQPSGMYDRLGYRVIALLVDDLPAIRTRIHQTGRKTTDPVVIVGKLEVSFAKDSDGNLLELIGLPEPKGEALADRVQIGLTVGDAEKSRAFYGQTLGLEEQPEMEMSQSLTRYAFSAGSTTIKFWSPDPSPEAGTGPIGNAVGIRYVTFSVPDLDLLCSDIAARGAKIVLPPTVLPGGTRISFTCDPDGNWIEFVEVVGEEAGTQ